MNRWGVMYCYYPALLCSSKLYFNIIEFTNTRRQPNFQTLNMNSSGSIISSSHILPACQSTVAGDFIRNSARSPRIDSQGVRIRLAQYQKQQIQEGTGCQCPKFRALLVPVEDEINELPQQWRTTEMLGLVSTSAGYETYLNWVSD